MSCSQIYGHYSIPIELNVGTEAEFIFINVLLQAFSTHIADSRAWIWDTSFTMSLSAELNILQLFHLPYDM